ncbi:MAG: hypothetical protein OSB57_04165 [Planctomycetota bacterium]|nr:hypothetical protein [Planctomycetota bacterium]
MSIGKTAQELGDEIRAAEEWRDAHIHHLPELRRQAVGPGFLKDSRPQEYQPEGNVYEFMSITLPRMVYNNPRVRVTSRDQNTMMSGEEGELSDVDALRHTLNRWVRDRKMVERLIPYAIDGFFAYGSGIIYQQPLFNPPSNADLQLAKGRTPMNPMWRRLLPERRFWDAVADSRDELRFSGHMYYMSPSEITDRVKAGEDWNEEILQKADNAKQDRKRLGDEKRYTVAPERKEIELRDIWVPEHETDDQGENKDQDDRGFHGTLYTLVNVGSSDGSTWELARPPRAFYGPHDGPYTDWGGYAVGDDTFWLSPLVGLETQASHLNKMARAVEKGNESFKKGIAVSDGDPALAAHIKHFMDTGVFLVNSDEVKGAITEMSLGGADSEQYAALNAARENYERMSGISDVRRGSLGGSGSATEVSIADNAATVRFDYLNKQFQGGVKDILRKAAWYFCEDDRSRYPLGPELVQEMGLTDVFEPGNFWYAPPEDEIPFEAYEFEIEMYSMERVNEGLHQKRVMDFHGIFLQTIEAAATFGPESADWNALLKMSAEALNLPDMGVKLNVDGLIPQQPAPEEQPGPAQGGMGMPGQDMGAQLGAL